MSTIHSNLEQKVVRSFISIVCLLTFLVIIFSIEDGSPVWGEEILLLDLTVAGELGTRDGQFREPTSILPLDQTTFCVIDYRNHRISKWDTSGRWLATCGGYGLEPGQLYFPQDICLVDGRKHLKSGETKVIACIDKSYRIQYFSTDCTFLDRKKLSILPKFITSSGNGSVLIMDSNNAVFLLESTGGDLKKVSLSVSPESPTAFAYDQTTRMLFISSSTNRIYSLNLDIDHHSNISHTWFEPQGMYSPSDIFIAPDHSLFVTDLFMSQVFNYDQNGVLRTKFSFPKTSQFQVLNPIYCALSEKNLLFLSDKYRHRIIISSVDRHE